jgi:hypothetical protein
LQIGSSTLIDLDWSVPQSVTMDLVGSSGDSIQKQQGPSTLDNEEMANLLIVSVIPYTGLGNTGLSNTP